ncbi:MAG: hypothetical protein ABFS02_01900 [Pseudomonadota bacterium]
MKMLYKSAAVIALSGLLCVSVSAEEQPKAEPQGAAPMKGMGRGMGRMGGMGMAGMTEEQKDQHMRKMQENKLKMHDLMTRINASQDPKERDQLKEEHLQLMKAHHAKMMQQRQMKMKQRMQMQRGPGQKPEQ